jgi:hypothetical protein
MTQTILPASPLEWVRKANPATLDNWADEWDQLGAALEQVFQRYVDAVTKVDGAFWEGKTAQAAHQPTSLLGPYITAFWTKHLRSAAPPPIPLSNR